MSDIRWNEKSKFENNILPESAIVCRNETGQPFLQNPLEGAISLQEFQSRTATVCECQRISMCGVFC